MLSRERGDGDRLIASYASCSWLGRSGASSGTSPIVELQQRSMTFMLGNGGEGRMNDDGMSSGPAKYPLSGAGTAPGPLNTGGRLWVHSRPSGARRAKRGRRLIAKSAIWIYLAFPRAKEPTQLREWYRSPHPGTQRQMDRFGSSARVWHCITRIIAARRGMLGSGTSNRSGVLHSYQSQLGANLNYGLLSLPVRVVYISRASGLPVKSLITG